MNLIAICDVDGVVADLHDTWCELYNSDYDDDLTPEKIHCWDMTRCVKPECGEKIFKYLEIPTLYNMVQPIPGALEGVNRLRSMGYRVVFTTATGIHQSGKKLEWLEKHGFLELTHGGSKDYIEARDKSLIRGSLMIDDGLHNLKGFEGIRILFAQPHNFNEFFSLSSTDIIRTNDWSNLFENIWI